MSEGKLWLTKESEGTGWHGRLRIGRVQIGYHVYRHAGVLPDRWVFQPFLIYDRKRRRTEKPRP